MTETTIPLAPTPEQVLAAAMPANDAGAATIREYLTALLTAVWVEGEEFSGKCPFGNSGWEAELFDALEFADLIDHTWAGGRELVEQAIRSLGAAPQPAPARQSNLVEHARRELELIGEEQSTIDGYLNIIQAFANMGHSGGSASVAIPTINALLQFKNLRPLTDNPDEWNHIAEDQAGQPDLWQNQRNGEAFSNDEGKHYWLLSEGGTLRNPKAIHQSVRIKATRGQ